MDSGKEGMIDEVAISTSNTAFHPALVAPSMDDFFVNIRPRRDVTGTGWTRGAAISDSSKLAGTIWEDKSSSNITIYVGPVVSIFGFGIDPVTGDISQEEVQERMLDSCGSMAKFWVTSLQEAKENGSDIWKVLNAFGEDALKSMIPGWGSEFHVRHEAGSCDVIPVTNDSVSPQGYEAVKTSMGCISVPTVSTSVPVAIAPVPALSLAEKQIQGKMMHSVNKFKGVMMCADLNFKAGTMENFHLPELSPKYLKIVSSQAGTAVMNANFKSLLDSANKASNPQMDGMILMAARCMGDHDPNLATAFCMGNWMQVPLADLERESLSYSIWQHGKETDAKRSKRKEFEATELAEDLVAEETTNKSKKRLLINNVRAVSDLKHYHQITANTNADISACVQVVKTQPILWQCLHHLFEVLGDEYVKAWHERHNSAQPQFWIWIVQTLECINAGMASATSTMDTMDAIENGNMSQLMEMVYEQPFERFCDDISEIKRMSRSERHMEIVPSIAPEYLKLKSHKRQKSEDVAKPEQGPSKGNGNDRKPSDQQNQRQNNYNALPQVNGGNGGGG